MDNNDLKERDFEAYIEHWLLTEGGYTKGDQSTYDKERAIDLKTLVKFLRLTQTKKWELYEKKYGAQTEDRLYNVLQDKIHERGLIWVLRNGIDDLEFKFKLVYFEPASPLNEDLNLKYSQNIMECTRQFAYSTQNHNTIDMVLSVNGIPVVALELKTDRAECGELTPSVDERPRPARGTIPVQPPYIGLFWRGPLRSYHDHRTAR